MHHIIYMSSAVVPFSKAELETLLDKSRKNNAALAVTGLLLHKDGNFLQVIEGEKAVVDALYDRITRDSRHRGLLPFVRENLPAREFADWSMAFRDLDSDPDSKAGFNELLNAGEEGADLSAYSNKVRAFMKMFVS